MAARKKLRLLQALAANKCRPSTPFIRVLPTDYCNLKCSYCWQHTNDKHMMSEELFLRCLDNALKLDVGLISFLGGEPTLWPVLDDAIAACHQQHVFTDITTNGSTLDQKRLHQLADAGLDLLNISVDGLKKTATSQKCSLSKPGLLQDINTIRANSGMKVRINSVICKNNWPLIQELLKVSKQHDIPISLGFAMFQNEAEFDPDIHFNRNDIVQIQSIVDDLKTARKQGVKIIDPHAYFAGFLRFLSKEQFWLCNYATRRGWINIDPYGNIRDCTKKFNQLDYSFAELTRDQITEVRAILAQGVEHCNPECYSNCAFDGAYFAKHKFQFMASGLMD